MINHPLKLLIVEDESGIRNLLRLILDWDKLGIQIAGEASTGSEALCLMEEELPDIVLTDIEMPYMDGLELSEIILERYQDVTVIILTAHDHFVFAQKALRAGVTNYLLKPVEKDKLALAMEEATKKIWDRRSLLNEMEISYKYIHNNLQFFRDRVLADLILNGPVEGLKDILEMVGIQFESKSRFSLALMHIAHVGPASFTSGRYLLLNNCRAYIEENYAANDRLYVFLDGLEYLAILSHDIETDLPSICKRIIKVLSESMDCKVYCGVSDPYQSLNDLPMAHTKAKDAARLAFITEEDVVFSKRTDGEYPSIERYSFEEQTKDLLLFVKSGMASHAVSMAVKILKSSVKRRGGDLSSAKLLAFQMLSLATNVLTSQNVPFPSLMSLVSPSYTELLEKETFPEVETLLSGRIEALCILAESYIKKESNEILSKVISDLEENYSDPQISLVYIAGKYAVNSSYLSRIFKGYTGKSFSEYLMEMRIQKAIGIMEKGSNKAYQLAQLVGIPDPNYFAKCFKKVTGISFQAYKAEHIKWRE